MSHISNACQPHVAKTALIDSPELKNCYDCVITSFPKNPVACKGAAGGRDNTGQQGGSYELTLWVLPAPSHCPPLLSIRMYTLTHMHACMCAQDRESPLRLGLSLFTSLDRRASLFSSPS